MEVDVIRKVVESSPVIVLIVLAANVFLWRKIEAKDAALMSVTEKNGKALAELFEKNARALSDVTASNQSMAEAVRDLRHAIERNERH